MKRNNRYMYYILSFSCLYFLSTCYAPDPDLSIERKDYIGESLRIDGYYYYTNLNDLYIEYRFFFKNGVCLRHASRTTDIQVVDNEILNKINSLGKEKINWGIFHIIGDKITYKHWISPHEGGFEVALSEGYILNDTTYKIVKESYSTSAYPPDIQEKFWHFRQFAHKPDSTNNFIK